MSFCLPLFEHVHSCSRVLVLFTCSEHVSKVYSGSLLYWRMALQCETLDHKVCCIEWDTFAVMLYIAMFESRASSLVLRVLSLFWCPYNSEPDTPLLL